MSRKSYAQVFYEAYDSALKEAEKDRSSFYQTNLPTWRQFEDYRKDCAEAAAAEVIAEYKQIESNREYDLVAIAQAMRPKLCFSDEGQCVWGDLSPKIQQHYLNAAQAVVDEIKRQRESQA